MGQSGSKLSWSRAKLGYKENRVKEFNIFWIFGGGFFYLHILDSGHFNWIIFYVKSILGILEVQIC